MPREFSGSLSRLSEYPFGVECIWNVMARAHKPDFCFGRNGRVHLNGGGGRQFSRLLASRGVRISGSNAGYTMFRGSVKSTGYPLYSPISPSLPLPCVTVCHHISAGLYLRKNNTAHTVALTRELFQLGPDFSMWWPLICYTKQAPLLY